ncbi:uncharacterized protein [Antedon mediterranea]|uniref:uncharacterized protein n=1 Tax=Antedon mediterranea TaxID=105859 RepID=UPI003AF7F2C0
MLMGVIFSQFCEWFVLLIGKTESIKETEIDMSEFSKNKLESALNNLFKNKTTDARRQFASKCAEFLQTKTGETRGTIKSETAFCEATVGEYTMKVTINKGRVNTNLIVDFQDCSCLADDESHGRMSRVFEDFTSVDARVSSSEPDVQYWTKLLSHWKYFTSSFREKGFSNLKLIFCGLNGEQVTFNSKNVKYTVMVHQNDKHREEVMFCVDEINKRTLANIILKLCGNEGAEQTTEQAGLRRLLQAFMTKLEADKVTSYKNVKLSLYGQGNSSFHISSGETDQQKEVTGYVDSKGEFHIHEREASRRCIIS